MRKRLATLAVMGALGGGFSPLSEEQHREVERAPAGGSPGVQKRRKTRKAKRKARRANR